MLERIKQLFTPKPFVNRGRLSGHLRNYFAGNDSRFTSGWNSGPQSSDSILYSQIAKIRGRSRDLIRNAPYAANARRIVVNNVIGSGIGLQGAVTKPRGALWEEVNSSIEAQWEKWTYAKSCHTGGILCFGDLERLLMSEVFTAGEAFVRLHLDRFGSSKVPLALEYIEPERAAEEFQVTYPGTQRIRLGIEVDEFGRPQAYYFHRQHPGDHRLDLMQRDEILRVPSDAIIHLYICTRWPQHRGEPWMHATARRLYDMDGYSEAEIIAARVSAAHMGFLKTAGDGFSTDVVGSQQQLTLAPGIIEKIGLEDEFISHTPNRPNTALDPFMRYMLREVAAGVGISYESLSKDYSQATYSSARQALLEDRDNWKSLQSWFIRAFRYPLHEIWMRQAVLSGAIPEIPLDQFMSNPDKFTAVKFKPRGWGWVDPTKEVEAYKEAIRGGLTTLTDVIAQTANGQDIEDIIETRARELDMLHEKGIETDTEPLEAKEPQSVTSTAKVDSAEDFRLKAIRGNS